MLTVVGYNYHTEVMHYPTAVLPLAPAVFGGDAPADEALELIIFHALRFPNHATYIAPQKCKARRNARIKGRSDHK